MEVKYSLAARMVQRMTGTAKMRARLIPLDKLRPVRARAAEADETDDQGNITRPGAPAVKADWTYGIRNLIEDLEGCEAGEHACLVLQEVVAEERRVHDGLVDSVPRGHSQVPGRRV